MKKKNIFKSHPYIRTFYQANNSMKPLSFSISHSGALIHQMPVVSLNPVITLHFADLNK